MQHEGHFMHDAELVPWEDLRGGSNDILIHEDEWNRFEVAARKRLREYAGEHGMPLFILLNSEYAVAIRPYQYSLNEENYSAEELALGKHIY